MQTPVCVILVCYNAMGTHVPSSFTAVCLSDWSQCLLFVCKTPSTRPIWWVESRDSGSEGHSTQQSNQSKLSFTNYCVLHLQITLYITITIAESCWMNRKLYALVPKDCRYENDSCNVSRPLSRNNLQYWKIRQTFGDHFVTIIFCLLQRHCRRLVWAAHMHICKHCKMCPLSKTFYHDFLKSIFFVVKWSFGDSCSCYRDYTISLKPNHQGNHKLLSSFVSGKGSYCNVIQKEYEPWHLSLVSYLYTGVGLYIHKDLLWIMAGRIYLAHTFLAVNRLAVISIQECWLVLEGCYWPL